jgi:hypothetical protein
MDPGGADANIFSASPSDGFLQTGNDLLADTVLPCGFLRCRLALHCCLPFRWFRISNAANAFMSFRSAFVKFVF